MFLKKGDNFTLKFDSWEDLFNKNCESSIIWCSEESNNFQFNYIDRLSILFLRLLLDKQKDGFLVSQPFNY